MMPPPDAAFDAPESDDPLAVIEVEEEIIVETLGDPLEPLLGVDEVAGAASDDFSAAFAMVYSSLKACIMRAPGVIEINVATERDGVLYLVNKATGVAGPERECTLRALSLSEVDEVLAAKGIEKATARVTITWAP